MHILTQARLLQVTEWNFGLKLLLVIEQVSPSYAMLITVFYWAVLSTGDEEADNIMRHGGNLVVLLVNSMAGDVPFISYHIQFGILFGTLYLIFMWIYHAISGIWVYSALAIEEEDLGSLVYYAVLPILFILCFYVW